MGDFSGGAAAPAGGVDVSGGGVAQPVGEGLLGQVQAARAALSGLPGLLSRVGSDELPELAAAAAQVGLSATASDTVSQAVEMALARAREDEVVLVTGSLFVVAEARRAWMRLGGLPEPPADPPDVY